MTHERRSRPGPALLTLSAIVAITAAWWALALWPVGADPPEWLARTRSACFGAPPNGLPDAGGWILLIGEPAGMAALFLVLWQRSLRSELERLRRMMLWRFVASGVAVAALGAFGILGVRVARAYSALRPIDRVEAGLRTTLDIEPPRIPLVDQFGRRVSLAEFRGRSVLLAFAFGHCTTVCPMTVRNILEARRASGGAAVELVVLTLDPWRDTPDRLPHLARQWGLASGDRVLSGPVTDVQATLDALGVGRRRNEVNGSVDHAATIMLLDGRGRIAWRIDGWAGGASELRSHLDTR